MLICESDRIRWNSTGRSTVKETETYCEGATKGGFDRLGVAGQALGSDDWKDIQKVSRD